MGNSERYAALGGVLFVVADAIVAVAGREPPDATASSGEVAAYFSDRSAALAAGLWLFGLGSVALIWWFGSLWRRMVRAENGIPRLAVVSLVGLVLGGALSLASAAVWAATALRIDDVGEDAMVFYTVGAVLLAASGFGIGAHLVATNVLGARSRTLAVWLVVVGFAAALAFLASAVLQVTAEGTAAPTVSLVGFVLWCVWILGVSYRIWTDQVAALGSAPA